MNATTVFVFLVFIIVYLTSSCTTTSPWQRYANHPGKGLYRYENEEVICYELSTSDSTSLQCQFKPSIFNSKR